MSEPFISTAQPRRGGSRWGLVLAMLALALGCSTTPVDPTGMPTTATEGQKIEARRLLMLSIDAYVEQTIRVQRISQRVRVAGSDLCPGELSAVTGAALIDIDDLPATVQALALERFGSRKHLHVVAVFDGLPAARAGIRVGDALIDLDGVALREMSKLARTRSLAQESDMELEIQRDGQSQTVELSSLLGCRFPVSVSHKQTINAATDFREIWVNAGLFRILDDSQLAFIIGHEMGHGILRRIQYRSRRGGPKLEAEADYLGAYLSARAGFDPIDSDLWEHFQRDLKSLGEVAGRSHPATHARTLALRDTISEIKDKIARGAPLVPEDG